MRRDFRHITIVGLLMWSLMHAWFGHDLFHDHHDQGHHHEHGHHHRQGHQNHHQQRVDQGHETPGEATHTKAVCRADTNFIAQLVPAAMLVGFCDFLLPKPIELTQEPDFEVAVYIEPQFLERPHSPRAPPAFSSIV